MSTPTQNNDTTSQNAAPNDKELNFRALEAKYQRQIELERAARIEAEKVAQEALSKRQHSSQDDDEDDDEPYVDKRKLKKTLNQFSEQTRQHTQSEIQKAVHIALQEEKKQNWLKQNNDFYEVLNHAERLAQQDPELAETILSMPEGFERQKLVYKNIKALGLHKEPQKQATIQEKIDANKRSPYYQPSGVGTAPYAQVGDFSSTGQKQAYEKMQALISQRKGG